jgi:hypothetical protein
VLYLLLGGSEPALALNDTATDDEDEK